MTREERFKVERYYRAARRGSAGVVQDGWLLADALTGMTRHISLKADVRLAIDKILEVEEEVRQRIDTVDSWDGEIERHAMLPNVEIYLYDKDGDKMRFRYAGAPVLVERAYAPMRLVEWLREMGLGQLSRRVREEAS